MPAINFQKGFVPLILSGEKPHTIRPQRKHAFKPGQTIYLFTGLRTKQTKRIGTATCESVRTIRISKKGDVRLEVFSKLTPLELYVLATRDGFKNSEDFVEFFKTHYGLPFRGVLVQWGPVTPC